MLIICLSCILPDISRRTLQRDLKLLNDQRLLLLRGHTDQLHYYLNPKLNKNL